MELEQINKRLKIISDLQEELNKIKAIYDESVENDPEFQKIQELEKKFKEEHKDKKTKIKELPTLKNMEEETKKLRNEIKENKEILAQQLADYYKESGSLQIVDEEGETKRIIFSVKLVKS